MQLQEFPLAIFNEKQKWLADRNDVFAIGSYPVTKISQHPHGIVVMVLLLKELMLGCEIVSGKYTYQLGELESATVHSLIISRRKQWLVALKNFLTKQNWLYKQSRGEVYQ